MFGPESVRIRAQSEDTVDDVDQNGTDHVLEVNLALLLGWLVNAPTRRKLRWPVPQRTQHIRRCRFGPSDVLLQVNVGGESVSESIHPTRLGPKVNPGVDDVLTGRGEGDVEIIEIRWRIR